jgi:hypothetical protein
VTAKKFLPGDRVIHKLTQARGEVQWLEGCGPSRVLIVRVDDAGADGFKRIPYRDAAPEPASESP